MVEEHYWLRVDLKKREIVGGNLGSLSIAEQEMMINAVPTIFLKYHGEETHRRFAKTTDEAFLMEGHVPIRSLRYDYQGSVIDFS